ncbi:MAG: lipopolysaccharide biosynthesis protein, partial [Planctomycetota bacterium]
MDHPRDEHQITQRVRRGGTWIACAQVASQVWGFLILAILYRWVGNVPYGLLGMVLVPVALARIFLTSGLDVAAVQDEKLTEDQLSALFWMNQFLGVATALAIGCSAPLLVRFYHEPRVGPVAWAMAGTTVVTALGLQHQALLQRRLRLGVLAVLRVVSQLVGGVAAVAVAWSIGGVWALITQQYAELVTLAVLAWWFEPWRPRLRLFGVGTRRLLRFGTNYTFSSLMFFLSTNIDKALIGHFFGASVLGLYGQAFNLAMKPVHTIVTPLTGIMLPALSRAQNDRAAYHRLLRSFVRFLALSLLPCGVGLALTAPEAILVLGGKEWAAAGTMLAVLAMAIPFQGVLNALGSVYASVGRADRLAIASCGVAAVLAAAFAAA